MALIQFMRQSNKAKLNCLCRSPWTNEYVPELPDGTKPSPRLRVLEEAANDAFSIYREMYYEGTGVSSVYLWDLEDPNASSTGAQAGGSFAGVVLLKKTASGANAKGGDGSWDSIHVFEVSERSRTGNYKLTSTVSTKLTLIRQRPYLRLRFVHSLGHAIHDENRS